MERMCIGELLIFQNDLQVAHASLFAAGRYYNISETFLTRTPSDLLVAHKSPHPSHLS